VELNQAIPEQDMLINALNMQQKYIEDLEQQDVIQMAEGGTVQTQKQEDVGAFVPPPKQNFTTLPTVQNPGATFDPNATIGDISAQMATAPQLPMGAQVQPVGVTPTTGQFIPTNIGVQGQVALPAAQAGTATAQQQTKTQAQQLQAQAVTPQVQEALQTIQGAQVTDQERARSQVQAQQQVGTSVANLTAAQGTATKMTNPVQREIQAGELVSPTANAEKAKAFTEQVQAATASPTDKATVAGQLATLTANFDATNPPAWAAGAIRGVQAVMQQRGLGASSIAGQALVQAAMESALPVAQADARTVAAFETQNLSNRQQRAMLAAQQRAQFIGQEFDQGFQAKVQNAAKIADIANRNFTAEQQVALENSRAAQTMNLNNLSNRQALTMAEASALASMDSANLNARQQSAVQNAQSFLQMDMANLSNRQQADMFGAQQQIQSLFTDQAAQNAARQFNATSQNQVDQFFASLGQQANQFNATQMNAQEQFNAGQANTIERFNAEINNQRDQFNAQNQLVIAQANANWRRQLATADTVAINRANELNAQNILGISNQAYNNLWQYYGDTMEWAWTSAENERSRVIELAIAQLAADNKTNIQEMKNDYNSSSAFGSLIGKFVTGSMFGGGGLFG
tara:strand:+ start:44 stop:1936 length:1893 start_codon:yes stop_codon:yes gene_type:complete